MATRLSPAAAAALLRDGGVIAYPTEGVWGLGCDPRNEMAVSRLLEIKQRPVGKGLILIAANVEQLRDFVDLDTLTTAQREPVLASWPGANTWVLPKRGAAPCWISGAHDSIAVRVSAHAPVIALCAAFGGALVSTSANLSGQPAPRHRDEFDPQLLRRIDGVLEGETGGLSKPTPIRDARSGSALRN